jgi:hypothetical protein
VDIFVGNFLLLCMEESVINMGFFTNSFTVAIAIVIIVEVIGIEVTEGFMVVIKASIGSFIVRVIQEELGEFGSLVFVRLVFVELIIVA